MKIKRYQILILAGILLLIFGQLTELVILQIQEYEFYPEDNATYNELTYIQAITPISIKLMSTSVTAIPTGPPVYIEQFSLTCVDETESSKTWRSEVDVSLSDGDYRCWFWAGGGDSSSLPKEFHVDFKIQSTTTLGGSFYINNILVTDPDQIITLDTLTLALRFTPTEGTPTSVSASWQGIASGSVDFAQSGANWLANIDLPTSGTYTMTLTATDGTSVITMSIFDLDLLGNGNGEDTLQGMPYFSIFGCVLIGVGAVIYLKQRRRGE